MSLKVTVIGINNFLSIIYDKEMRLSILLSQADFNPSEIELISQQYMAQIVESFLEALKNRLIAGHDGERLYLILKRRFGLDGKRAETLQDIGERLGISRERVRQLEKKVLGRCRHKKTKEILKSNLKTIALQLLGK